MAGNRGHRASDVGGDQQEQEQHITEELPQGQERRGHWRRG